jgi:hypothetical protein
MSASPGWRGYQQEADLSHYVDASALHCPAMEIGPVMLPGVRYGKRVSNPQGGDLELGSGHRTE